MPATLTKHHDSVRVSAKMADPLLDPAQSQLDVPDALVPRHPGSIQTQEPEGAQPVVDSHQDDAIVEEELRPVIVPLPHLHPFALRQLGGDS